MTGNHITSSSTVPIGWCPARRMARYASAPPTGTVRSTTGSPRPAAPNWSMPFTRYTQSCRTCTWSASRRDPAWHRRSLPADRTTPRASMPLGVQRFLAHVAHWSSRGMRSASPTICSTARHFRPRLTSGGSPDGAAVDRDCTRRAERDAGLRRPRGRCDSRQWPRHPVSGQPFGAGCQVIGFDIQQAALNAANARLIAAGLDANVTLLSCGHERLGENLPPDWHGSVSAVMFNLGYLPGGDKRLITHADTTLAALQQALFSTEDRRPDLVDGLSGTPGCRHRGAGGARLAGADRTTWPGHAPFLARPCPVPDRAPGMTAIAASLS